MALYPGNRIEQNYRHGLDDGRLWGENDLELGLGTVSDWLRAAREDVLTASTPESKAFALGYLRGYRESVRTLQNGRWGV